jgi:hypothetical protein
MANYGNAGSSGSSAGDLDFEAQLWAAADKNMPTRLAHLLKVIVREFGEMDPIL